MHPCSTDTLLLDWHLAARLTPRCSTDTSLLDWHLIARQTPHYSLDTLLLARHTATCPLAAHETPGCIPHWRSPSDGAYHIDGAPRTGHTTLTEPLGRGIPHWWSTSNRAYHIDRAPQTGHTTLKEHLRRSLPHWRSPRTGHPTLMEPLGRGLGNAGLQGVSDGGLSQFQDAVLPLSTGIPIIKIRQCHNPLIFIIEIPTPERMVFILNHGPAVCDCRCLVGGTPWCLVGGTPWCLVVVIVGGTPWCLVVVIVGGTPWCLVGGTRWCLVVVIVGSTPWCLVGGTPWCLVVVIVGGTPWCLVVVIVGGTPWCLVGGTPWCNQGQWGHYRTPHIPLPGASKTDSWASGFGKKKF